MVCAANPFLKLACIALTVYWFLLLAWIVLSWAQVVGFRPGMLSGFARTAYELLDDVTRPVLSPLNRILPPARVGGMGLSLAPALAFIVIFVLRAALRC
jgi:YggT family protein